MRSFAGFVLAIAVLPHCGSSTPQPTPLSAATTAPPSPTVTASPSRPAAATIEVRYPWEHLVVSPDGRTLTVTVPYYGDCDTFSRLTLDESLADGSGQRFVQLETYKQRPAQPGAECARRNDAPTVRTVTLREPLGDREVVQRSRPAPVPRGSSPDPSAEHG
jgi:hypothetical protein